MSLGSDLPTAPGRSRLRSKAAAILRSGVTLASLAGLCVPGFAAPPAYDVVIRQGTIYDGSGAAPIVGDV